MPKKKNLKIIITTTLAMLSLLNVGTLAMQKKLDPLEIGVKNNTNTEYSTNSIKNQTDDKTAVLNKLKEEFEVHRKKLETYRDIIFEEYLYKVTNFIDLNSYINYDEYNKNLKKFEENYELIKTQINTKIKFYKSMINNIPKKIRNKYKAIKKNLIIIYDIEEALKSIDEYIKFIHGKTTILENYIKNNSMLIERQTNPIKNKIDNKTATTLDKLKKKFGIYKYKILKEYLYKITNFIDLNSYINYDEYKENLQKFEKNYESIKPKINTEIETYKSMINNIPKKIRNKYKAIKKTLIIIYDIEEALKSIDECIKYINGKTTILENYKEKFTNYLFKIIDLRKRVTYNGYNKKLKDIEEKYKLIQNEIKKDFQYYETKYVNNIQKEDKENYELIEETLKIIDDIKENAKDLNKEININKNNFISHKTSYEEQENFIYKIDPCLEKISKLETEYFKNFENEDLKSENMDNFYGDQEVKENDPSLEKISKLKTEYFKNFKNEDLKLENIKHFIDDCFPFFKKTLIKIKEYKNFLNKKISKDCTIKDYETKFEISKDKANSLVQKIEEKIINSTKFKEDIPENYKKKYEKNMYEIISLLKEIKENDLSKYEVDKNYILSSEKLNKKPNSSKNIIVYKNSNPISKFIENAMKKNSQIKSLDEIKNLLMKFEIGIKTQLLSTIYDEIYSVNKKVEDAFLIYKMLKKDLTKKKDIHNSDYDKILEEYEITLEKLKEKIKKRKKNYEYIKNMYEKPYIEYNESVNKFNNKYQESINFLENYAKENKITDLKTLESTDTYKKIFEDVKTVHDNYLNKKNSLKNPSNIEIQKKSLYESLVDFYETLEKIYKLTNTHLKKYDKDENKFKINTNKESVKKYIEECDKLAEGILGYKYKDATAQLTDYFKFHAEKSKNFITHIEKSFLENINNIKLYIKTFTSVLNNLRSNILDFNEKEYDYKNGFTQIGNKIKLTNKDYDKMIKYLEKRKIPEEQTLKNNLEEIETIINYLQRQFKEISTRLQYEYNYEPENDYYGEYEIECEKFSDIKNLLDDCEKIKKHLKEILTPLFQPLKKNVSNNQNLKNVSTKRKLSAPKELQIKLNNNLLTSNVNPLKNYENISNKNKTIQQNIENLTIDKNNQNLKNVSTKRKLSAPKELQKKLNNNLLNPLRNYNKDEILNMINIVNNRIYALDFLKININFDPEYFDKMQSIKNLIKTTRNLINQDIYNLQDYYEQKETEYYSGDNILNKLSKTQYDENIIKILKNSVGSNLILFDESNEIFKYNDKYTFDDCYDVIENRSKEKSKNDPREIDKIYEYDL